MERNRETRRGIIVGSNGFNRRRHRTNTLREFPDEDGGVELQESVRLRDRVKKDRERERDRDSRGRSKRRRSERDESSEESTNDEDYDESEENTAAVLTPAAGSVSNNHHHGHLSNHHSSHGSNLSQHHNSNSNITGNNHHLHHRKSFPLGSSSSKVFRAAPVWKPDEVISVSVPRRARSASTKRSHDRMSSSSNNTGGGEQNLRQASNSPARQGLASTSTPPAPMSPSSSNPFFRKKLKPAGNNGGPKVKPPKSSASKQSSLNPEELEIEIAEVLYGLSHQTQGPPSKKEDSSMEADRSKNDAKSSPISTSSLQNTQISGPNTNPTQAVAAKRKKPRPVVENSSPVGPISAKQETDQTEGNSVISQGPPAKSPPPAAEDESRDNKDLVAKKDVSLSKERESSTVRNEDKDSTLIETAAAIIKGNSMVSEVEREQKIEIDLMASPSRARSSPEMAAAAMDQKPAQPSTDAELKDRRDEMGSGTMNATAEEGKMKSRDDEECESNKESNNKGRSITLQLDLQRAERNGNVAGNVNAGSKLQELPLKASKEEPLGTDKSGQSKSSSMPMGFMAAAGPLQGAVSLDGTTVQPQFTQPRPKRCATHCYIARNIHCHQQLMKMNPFLQAVAGSASLFASKPSNNLNAVASEMHASKGSNTAQANKNHIHKSGPGDGVKDKSSQNAVTTSDSSQRKQQVLIQQTMPPSNLLGPAFIFPLNQQQATSVADRPKSAKANSAHETARSTSSNPPGSAAMTFSYTNMAAAAPNEAQYLAILQNNGYPFPITAPPNYRGPTPALFNGPFYSSQMIHPSQIQHQQQQQTRSQSSGLTNSNVQNFQNSEKKPQQQSTSHSFAMSFGPINGANGGLDFTSMAQNHAIFQNLPEASRQMMAAAAAAAHKMNFKISEDDKSGNGGESAAAAAATDDERKNSIAFSSNQAQFQQQMAAKFPNSFPQNAVQSPSQPPQWKNSARTQAAAQAPSMKNLPQHNPRPGTKMQNQISFGGNQKPSTASQDHMTASTNSKTGQNPSFSTQLSKNQSILGNPNSGAKPQVQQAKNMPQAQLFFSNQYSNTNSTNSGASGFYMQRRPMQQAQANNTMTNDPAKAIAAAQFAAAAAQSAGGALLPAGFSYVQVKPTEQKQPAG